MQEEKHQENREEIHSKEQSAQLQPDNAELDRQPEQEAILSQARTTATFDVGSFLN